MKNDIFAADGIYRRSRKPTNGKMHHFTVENGKLVWQTDGCQLSFSDSIDIPADASPENVKDGKTRTADGELNAWVSDRRQGLPQSFTLKQSITLMLKAEKEISNV